MLDAAEAAIRVEQDVIDKLRQIAVGLQQDLALAAGDASPDVPGDGGVTLTSALRACRERIACESAVLAKLQQLRQGLVADLVGGRQGTARG